MSWLSRIAAIVRSRKLERDLDQELQFHMELKAQENIAAGMEPEEARYAALRAFGGVEQKKEECRTASHRNGPAFSSFGNPGSGARVRWYELLNPASSP